MKRMYSKKYRIAYNTFTKNCVCVLSLFSYSVHRYTLASIGKQSQEQKKQILRQKQQKPIVPLLPVIFLHNNAQSVLTKQNRL